MWAPDSQRDGARCHKRKVRVECRVVSLMSLANPTGRLEGEVGVEGGLPATLDK